MGSPTSGPWTGISCQISGSIRLKCTINAMCLNHPQTIPLHPQFMEKLSSVKSVPSAKKAGDHWMKALNLSEEDTYPTASPQSLLSISPLSLEALHSFMSNGCNLWQSMCSWGMIFTASSWEWAINKAITQAEEKEINNIKRDVTQKEKSLSGFHHRPLPQGADAGAQHPLFCTEGKKKSWKLEAMTLHVVSDSFEGSKFSWSLLLKLEGWNPRAGGIYKACWLPFLRVFGKIGYF